MQSSTALYTHTDLPAYCQLKSMPAIRRTDRSSVEFWDLNTFASRTDEHVKMYCNMTVPANKGARRGVETAT